jgi:hypothetical protein
MENKLITIEDLEIGDEIMISCQAYFKYLKVLSKPMISKTKVHWNTKQPLYSNVRCSTRQDVVTTNHTWGGKSYTRTQKTWIVTPEGHNITVSQDLNHRQVWLVKRETI